MNRSSGSLLAEKLEDAGCKAFQAANAADAIAILEQKSEVTVIFTDVQMPGTMGGIALAKYARNRWQPTVVCSGRELPPTQIWQQMCPSCASPMTVTALAAVTGSVHQRLTAH